MARLKRHLFIAWVVGLAISLVAVLCTMLSHTPVAVVGFALSLPLFPVMDLLVQNSPKISLSDASVGILMRVGLVAWGSVFYGALVFAVLRVREYLRTK